MPRPLIYVPSRPNIYLPDGWNVGWQAAKLAAAGSPVWCDIFGDSIACGVGSTDVEATGWFGLLRTSLKNALGLYADFYPAYSWSSQPNPATPGSMPWGAINGSVQLWNTSAPTLGNGYTRVAWSDYNGTQNITFQTFTTPYACTQLDIIYEEFAAGNWGFIVDAGGGSNAFTYSIDGAGAVGATTNSTVTVVQNTASATAASTLLHRMHLTGLPNTTHTVGYGYSTVNPVPIIQGISTFSQTGAGIGFGRFQYSGAKMDDYGNPYNVGVQSTLPANRFKLLQGTTPQRDSSTNTGFGFPTQPHLAVIALGVNDAINQVSPATYESYLRQMIQGLRRGQANCTIVLLAYNLPDGTNSDLSVSSFTAGSGVHYQYLKAMRDVAQLFGCAFINIHQRWGEYALTNGFLSADIHPTTAGHADIASQLLSIL